MAHLLRLIPGTYLKVNPSSSWAEETAEFLCRATKLPPEKCIKPLAKGLEEQARETFREHGMPYPPLFQGESPKGHSVPTEEEIGSLGERVSSISEEVSRAGRERLTEVGRAYSERLDSLMRELSSTFEKLTPEEREVFRAYLRPLGDAYGAISKAKADLDSALEMGVVTADTFDKVRDSLSTAATAMPEARSRMRTIAEVCPSAVGHVTS